VNTFVITTPWKAGTAPASGAAHPTVSATRTEISRYRDLPGIARRGLGLRARWSENPGSIGMQLSLDLRQRVSWSISAWETEDDLERFVRSPHHLRAVAPYRARVTVAAARWEVALFDLDAAWAEARLRLAPRGGSI
jgi:heme-degrading monooxygenase HmoA